MNGDSLEAKGEFAVPLISQAAARIGGGKPLDRILLQIDVDNADVDENYDYEGSISIKAWHHDMLLDYDSPQAISSILHEKTEPCFSWMIKFLYSRGITFDGFLHDLCRSLDSAMVPIVCVLQENSFGDNMLRSMYSAGPACRAFFTGIGYFTERIGSNTVTLPIFPNLTVLGIYVQSRHHFRRGLKSLTRWLQGRESQGYKMPMLLFAFSFDKLYEEDIAQLKSMRKLNWNVRYCTGFFWGLDYTETEVLLHELPTEELLT